MILFWARLNSLHGRTLSDFFISVASLQRDRNSVKDEYMYCRILFLSQNKIKVLNAKYLNTSEMEWFRGDAFESIK